MVSSSPGGGGDAEHLLEKCSICLQHDHTPIGGGARPHFTNLQTFFEMGCGPQASLHKSSVLSRDGVGAAQRARSQVAVTALRSLTLPRHWRRRDAH